MSTVGGSISDGSCICIGEILITIFSFRFHGIMSKSDVHIIDVVSIELTIVPALTTIAVGSRKNGSVKSTAVSRCDVIVNPVSAISASCPKINFRFTLS